MPKKRIVLSGGPGTGKTTLLNELIAAGHHCFKEISREIIDREVKLKSDILPWDNLEAFTSEVIKGRKQQFNMAEDGMNFYDRSIIDSLAYMRKDKLTIKEEWFNLGKLLRYDEMVFITPPWEEIYTIDAQRKESYQTLLALHEVLINSYNEFGYTVQIIPKGSVKERLKFILDRI